jgi:hypothetical protein
MNEDRPSPSYQSARECAIDEQAHEFGEYEDLDENLDIDLDDGLSAINEQKPLACNHTPANSWWEHDGRGIPLARVCGGCREAVLSKYDPKILEYYTQADVDDQIEED